MALSPIGKIFQPFRSSVDKEAEQQTRSPSVRVHWTCWIYLATETGRHKAVVANGSLTITLHQFIYPPTPPFFVTCHLPVFFAYCTPSLYYSRYGIMNGRSPIELLDVMNYCDYKLLVEILIFIKLLPVYLFSLWRERCRCLLEFHIVLQKHSPPSALGSAMQ